MKLIWKLFIAAIIIAILLPFSLLKGKDGKPLMNFGDLKLPEVSLPDMPGSKNIGTAVIGDSNSIYEWKDEEGNLQFSNMPPAEGIEYTVKEYDPNTNVIQAVEVPDKEPESASSEPHSSQETEPVGGTGIYSPEKIKKLIDDAKNVENLLNDRLKQQEAIIGQ